MGDNPEQEQARAADEAKRTAREEEERARAEAERVRAEAERVTAASLTGEGSREGVRQLGLIYGALIGVAVLMVQPFIAAPSLDASALVSIIAFSVAIPLLAGLAMVNWQEGFRGRRSTSVSVTVAQGIAQVAAITGIVAAFWHITWVAGGDLRGRRDRRPGRALGRLVAGGIASRVHDGGVGRAPQYHVRNRERAVTARDP